MEKVKLPLVLLDILSLFFKFFLKHVRFLKNLSLNQIINISFPPLKFVCLDLFLNLLLRLYFFNNFLSLFSLRYSWILHFL